MDTSTDNRLIELETKLAHQEHTIEELNQTVVKLQDKVEFLEKFSQKLAERLREIKPADAPTSFMEQEIPPHY
ncbi:MAG TPA: SlyX protein [Gammaproteobacteria bacterium]|nr:SlyX protein [Gammaproteobacteria bacterium]